MRPLEGVRVLDLSKVLAGPLCAQYLGDLGADVIKVEPPGGGDETRSWTPQREGEAAAFMAVNQNKRGIAVDMKSPEGMEIIRQLVEKSDVVIQGFASGTARKLGVDYESLKQINSRIVYCEISGYGRDGPMGNEPGYDVMLQAFSGMISTIGQRGGPAARVSFSPVDLGTGMHATSGILAGLMNRATTGEGCYVEVSLLDTAMGFMGYMASNYWFSNAVPVRMGMAHPSLCPYQAFRTQNGEVMLGVGNDRIWKKFCAEAGLVEYMEDPRFKTNADRVKNFDATCDIVQARLLSDTTESWIKRLRAAGVPISPLHTLAEALEHEQVVARGIVVESEHVRLGKIRHVAYPVSFNKAAREVRRAPPMLGEHTREILAELGYAPEAISSLADTGIVGALSEKNP
ncbi:CoA transferase [Bordetella petrii]|nr:CaiB/BaiF CoA-transferase family protein [Bordetella petrii]MCD0502206.1 CoA transferase [Bordetella petrii]